MAESKRDYYEVLGVPKDADDAALKKAYRVLAKKHHPDTNQGNPEAEAKFKEASEAYAVLSDPDKRRQYDQFGHAAFEGGGAGGFGGFDFNAADMGDIFGDIFGDLFGGGRRSRSNNGPMRGANLRSRIRITFEEALFGCEKEIELTSRDECKECGGTGAKQACPDCGGTGKIIKEKCPVCRGTGHTSSKKRISVSIPAGIDNGQSVRIRGKGELGVNGGERGDLLVEVVVSEHPTFRRQDTSIYSTVPISFTMAALGGEIRIKTVDGEVAYTVAPGTQTDTRIRLKGKGVPYLRNKDVRGDHYVTLVVKVPERMNKEQKEALWKFREAMGETLPSPAPEEKHKKKGFFNK